MTSIRREVLSCFKNLHKTRKVVFKGDYDKLEEVRRLINEGFRKNIGETDENKIKDQIKLGIDVEYEIRTTIIQAVEVKPNVLKLNIRPDVRKLDNIPFNENAVLEVQDPSKKCH